MIALKYIGRGAFVVGIPPRDLTEDEIKQFGGIKKLLATGLYQEPAERRKAVKDEPEAA